jgi:hypothetical protein
MKLLFIESPVTRETGLAMPLRIVRHTSLNSLGFLLQWTKGVTRRIDAFQQVRPQKALKPAKPLILHRVDKLVHDDTPLSPTISSDENAIPKRKPCGLG